MNCYSLNRITNSECVELHVLFVPDEQWNSRLNKVSVEAIDSFISAGFIRVYPDVSLKAIREELGSLFGPDRVMDRFCFLKCVGRSLALVKAKQEKDLKAKSFAPPYSPYPELYLLQVEENSYSLSSRSLSSDTVIYNTESQACYPPRPAFPSIQSKEPTKFPLIIQGTQQCVTDQSLEDEFSFTSLEEREEETLGLEKSSWTSGHKMCWNVQEELMAKQHEMPQNKQTLNAVEKSDIKRNFVRDSLILDMLESSNTGSFHSHERKSILSRTVKPTRNKASDEHIYEDRVDSIVPVVCGVLPSYGSSHMQKHSLTSLNNRDELLKEIRQVKEEKRQLERTRQELLRKGRELLALNRHCRNQARDKWKKKYFDTKKATAPLEETLTSLRQELETFYNKLFQQLQTRDVKNRQKRRGKLSNTKNDLIIQIMTESCEIEKQKKNIDDAKIKLATEIKLRKQAASELQALKAELTQKKSQCSYNGPLFSLADF